MNHLEILALTVVTGNLGGWVASPRPAWAMQPGSVSKQQQRKNKTANFKETNMKSHWDPRCFSERARVFYGESRHLILA